MTAEFIETMNERDYHAINRLSSTNVRRLLRSPAHYLEGLKESRDSSETLRLGSAIHAGLLEPETFSSRYVIAPKVDRRTKAGKDAWAEFSNANPGKGYISAEDAYLIEQMRISLHAHPLGARAFTGGTAELTALWDVEDQPCKARFDYLKRARGVGFDLKSTCDASHDGFARSIAQYGYHIQAAWYAIGYKVVTGEDLKDFIFVAIEKTPPYAVAVYRIEDYSLEEGKRKCLIAIDTLKKCLDENYWPGYSESLESIKLPAWAF